MFAIKNIVKIEFKFKISANELASTQFIKFMIFLEKTSTISCTVDLINSHFIIAMKISYLRKTYYGARSDEKKSPQGFLQYWYSKGESALKRKAVNR